MKVDLWYDDVHKTTKFKLLEDIQVGDYTLLRGMSSDGASVPRCFWWFCQAIDPRYAGIFAAHDFLYANHLTTRKQADLMMLQLLLDKGMCPVQAHIIYYSVRLFGWARWKKTEKDINSTSSKGVRK